MEVFFFSENDYVDHTKGYWNPKRQLGVTTHFSELNALQYGGIFLKKNKKIIFLSKFQSVHVNWCKCNGNCIEASK